MNRITRVTAAVLATLVAVAGAAFAQAGPGSGAGMPPTEPGTQSGAVQQEHERLQEQLWLLEQARVKEGGEIAGDRREARRAARRSAAQSNSSGALNATTKS